MWRSCYFLACLLLLVAAVDETSSSSPTTVASTTDTTPTTTVTTTTKATTDRMGHALIHCNNITKARLSVRDNPDDLCQLVESDPILGNQNGPFILDLNEATQTALNGFLAKKFTTIKGRIAMIGNDKVETINFGELKTWDADGLHEGSIWIEIRGNPRLKEIVWDGVGYVNAIEANGVKILIYNNPLLKTPIIQLTAIKNVVWVMTNENECQFQNPENEAKYATSHEIDMVLPLCEKIKGDLNLENRKITRNKLVLGENSCLKLVNVDMTGVAVFPIPEQGKVECADKKTVSEIRNNRGLCRKQLDELYKYFGEDADKVIIEPHSYCGETCSAQTSIEEQFTVCETITAAVDLTPWFTPAANQTKKQKYPEFKWKFLTKIEKADTVTISGPNVEKISFPNLTDATHLKITDNENLTEIELPALENIKELTITGNKNLEPSGLVKISKFPPKRVVECYTSITTVIENLRDLVICTVIKGDLVLKGIKSAAVEEDPLKDTIIEGCLTVQETELKDINFLENATIQCTGFHQFIDNPDLCKITTLQNKAADFDGTWREKGCGKTCKDLSEKKCGVFEGDLTILDSTLPEDWTELELIRGRLIIADTKFSNMTFLKLEAIEADKAPVIIVRNNLKLKWITAPHLKQVIAKDRGLPRVEIVDNVYLEDVQFLPIELSSSCTHLKTAPCWLYYTEKNADGMPLHAWFITAAIICHLLVAGAVVGWVIVKKPEHYAEHGHHHRKVQHSPVKKGQGHSQSPVASPLPSESATRSTPATKTATESRSRTPNTQTPKNMKTPKMEKEHQKKKAPK